MHVRMSRFRYLFRVQPHKQIESVKKCESLRVKFSVSASSFAAFADACDLFPALTAKIIIERFPKNKKYSEKGRIRDMNSKQCYSEGGSRNRISILTFILLCKSEYSNNYNVALQLFVTLEYTYTSSLALHFQNATPLLLNIRGSKN